MPATSAEGKTKFDGTIRDQEDKQDEFELSHLMWRENVGWGVCTDTRPAADCHAVYLQRRAREAMVRRGFFVNVSLAEETDQIIEDFLIELRDLVEDP